MTTPKRLALCYLALSLIFPHWMTNRTLAKGERPDPVEALAYFTEPAISPDRSEITFVSAGDIWTVPATGGEARLLVSHPANESKPLYSPDGTRLAFVSTRTGNGDIYVLTLRTGELRRLTFDDAPDQLNAWSYDGRWLYFSSTSQDIGSMSDIFRVSADGGTPVPISADRYTNEYFSAPSPDGQSLAFTARGLVSSQWWRKGHSHLDESEIWIRRDDRPAQYVQVTRGGAKELWPMWGVNGKEIFYVSDRSGAQNIWNQPLNGPAKQVSRFNAGRVLWPTISYDGRMIVFEHDFGIWKFDTASGQASEVKIHRRGLSPGPAVEHFSFTSQIQDFQLSPDGRKIAFIVRGEIFAASAKEGGEALRVTVSPANESQITWSPDSQALAYVSDREGASRIYLYDFRTRTERQVTGGPYDYSPRFSPDGKMVGFVRDGHEICVLDLDTKQEHVLTRANLERPPLASDSLIVWSPDNRWLAYKSITDRQFKNVFVVPATGGEGRPISFLANYGSNTVSWSPDGSFILFDTGQRVEGSQIARVDLIPQVPKFREDQFNDLFKQETAKSATPAAQAQMNRPSSAGAEPPVTPTRPQPSATDEQKKTTSKQTDIAFESIRQRLSLLPIDVDVDSQTISPDGKWVLIGATAAGQQNLYLYPLNPLSKEAFKPLTATAGYKRSAQFAPDGKEVYYLEGGRMNILPLDTRVPRPLAVSAEMDIDFALQKLEVFQQAWSYLRDHFFDPNFNGVDWPAARAAYAPRIAGAQTPEELRRLIYLMIGELNASHLGLSSAQGQTPPSVGKLGLRFDRAEYEAQGILMVTEVIPLGPAALAAEIHAGDRLIAVDGVQINAHTNLDELLNFKIGRRVRLTLGAGDAAPRREVIVQPVSSAAEKDLIYRKWVEEKRAYVAGASGGRLGYVHLYDMSSTSLAQLAIDLDTQNFSRAGVVIDIRNNNGGFLNGFAIDVFARRGYLTMTPRGLPAASSRTVLGQRALEAPTILVVNQHTLSDAEEFTEGYRALKLGKVVGEPTAGWVIYTPGTSLIDGSILRIPNTKITASDGTAMEMHPRPVDTLVVRQVGESYSQRDSQLDMAVRELLKQIGHGKDDD
jgi:tricorn protease